MNSKRRCKRHLVTALAMMMLVTEAWAAELFTGSSDCDPYVTDGWKVELGCLSSGRRSRFFRSFSLSVLAIDQPDDIIVPLDDGSGIDLERSFSNPQDRLWRYEIDFKPEQWFKSTAELGEVYSTALALSKAKMLQFQMDGTGKAEDPLSDETEKLRYFARARKGGQWKRIVSSISFSVRVSDRAQVAGTTLIDREVWEQDKTDLTGTLVFDPDKWIIFPSRVLSAYKALGSYTELYGTSSALKRKNPRTGGKLCGAEDRPIDCLSNLSDITVRGRWTAALIPTLSIESKDQFDFYQASGIFISSPLVEDTIETFKITWDLGSTLDTSSHRRAALAAIAKHHELVARDKALATKPKIKLSILGPVPVSKTFVYQLELEQKAGAVEWTLEKDSLAKGFGLTEQGLLIGTPSQTGVLQLSVTVCDTLGTAKSCNTEPVKLVVGPSEQTKAGQRSTTGQSEGDNASKSARQTPSKRTDHSGMWDGGTR